MISVLRVLVDAFTVAFWQLVYNISVGEEMEELDAISESPSRNLSGLMIG